MRTRRFWILPLLSALILTPTACDKGGGSETTPGQGQERERQQPRPAPAPEAAICDGICFTPLPSVGTNPRVAPRFLRYEDEDLFQIRNVTEHPLNLDGWYLSTGTASTALPNGIDMPINGNFTFHLGQAGTDDSTNAYLADPALSLDATGEVALFSAQDFTSPENIKLYMRWGALPSGDTNIEVAHQAELWHREAFIPVCDGYVGIVVVGNISIPHGFRSQTYECFQRLH